MLETKCCKDLILSLLKSQKFSGGFHSAFDEETEGIRETCRNTLLLIKCGIPHDGLNVQSAVAYILSLQNENGGWSENPELRIPEGVIELSNTQGITWLTADIIKLLRNVGLEKSEPCAKALNWLTEMQNGEGGWCMLEGDPPEGSDPDSTTQILFMMKEIFGEENPIWHKGIRLFEGFLDKMALDAERGYHFSFKGEKRENDIYHLTYLLLSSLVDSKGRIESGYDLEDVRVRKIVEAILDTQREDGGWRPFWTLDSDPTYTVIVLKLLVWLGVIDPEKLKKQVAKYI